MKQEYKLDGIMIGRGALLTPGIFRAIAYRLAGKSLSHPVMSWEEKRDFLLRFAQEMDDEFGTIVMLRRTRLLCRWFGQGFDSGLKLEGSIHKSKNLADALAAISAFFKIPRKQFRELSL